MKSARPLKYLLAFSLPRKIIRHPIHRHWWTWPIPTLACFFFIQFHTSVICMHLDLLNSISVCDMNFKLWIRAIFLDERNEWKYVDGTASICSRNLKTIFRPTLTTRYFLRRHRISIFTREIRAYCSTQQYQGKKKNVKAQTNFKYEEQESNKTFFLQYNIFNALSCNAGVLKNAFYYSVHFVACSSI